MKKYIKEVKRELSVPRRAKKEIARDLEEAFASALEHGESADQVMERLGSPKDYAESIEEQTKSGRAKDRDRKRLTQIVCSFAAALAFFVLDLIVRALQLPKDVIGQADSMTGIKVEAPFVFNPRFLIVALGMVALAVAIVLTINYRKDKHDERSNKRC